MSEPRRILEGDAEGLERWLLESAAGDDPSPARRRNLVAAASAVTVSTVASSAYAALALKTLLGLACAGGVAWGYLRATSDPEIRSADAPVAPALTRPVPVWPVPELATASVVASAPSSLPSVPHVASPPAKSATTTPSISIDREIALMDEARAAVSRGEGLAALAALDRYDRECPGGTLSTEAAVLRIEATALTGDRARASRLAAAFLASHPGSPHASRVSKFVLPE